MGQSNLAQTAPHHHGGLGRRHHQIADVRQRPHQNRDLLKVLARLNVLEEEHSHRLFFRLFQIGFEGGRPRAGAVQLLHQPIRKIALRGGTLEGDGSLRAVCGKLLDLGHHTHDGGNFVYFLRRLGIREMEHAFDIGLGQQ